MAVEVFISSSQVGSKGNTKNVRLLLESVCRNLSVLFYRYLVSSLLPSRPIHLCTQVQLTPVRSHTMIPALWKHGIVMGKKARISVTITRRKKLQGPSEQYKEAVGVGEQ